MASGWISPGLAKAHRRKKASLFWTAEDSYQRVCGPDTSSHPNWLIPIGGGKPGLVNPDWVTKVATDLPVT
jgi:hypothetical protein